MSEVFISYSQRARGATEALAAELGSCGIACWYDVSLLPNEVFWKVIMKRITDAKAVITVWSPPAIQSEWVYGETKLAHEQKKLICVRQDDVLPTDIPLPFNGYNVTPVSEIEPILDSLRRYGLNLSNQPISPQVIDQAMEPMADQVAATPEIDFVIAQAWAMIANDPQPDALEDFLRQFGRYDTFIVKQAARKLQQFAQPELPEPIAPVAHQTTVEDINAAEEDIYLRIEAGMHTAPIRRISVTADGNLLATASHDKTVKLWSLPDGELIRTLRPVIGLGDEGKMYSVVIDPAGEWVAAGGWTRTGENFVSIFDASTGSIIDHLGPLPNVIIDLAVSKMGDKLAAGLGGYGIRLWEKTGDGWALLSEDTDYGDRVNGIDFAADGRIATTSYDSAIRLYAPDGSLLKKAEALGGDQPFGIAFSPDGSQLAVGYEHAVSVEVLDAASLEVLYRPDVSNVSAGSIFSVAWRADGALLAGGRPTADGGPHLWEDGGRGAMRSLDGPSTTLMDLAPLDDGSFLFGASDPCFGKFNPQAEKVLWRGPAMADMRNKLHGNFLASDDARSLWFGLAFGNEAPVLFDIGQRSLIPMEAHPDGLSSPDTTRLSIGGWEDTLEPTLNGHPLPLAQYEYARSLAIAQDGSSFILGSDWWLWKFDANGQVLWQQAVPGTVWGVNLSQNGEIVIAAYGDGTIRWHRADNGDELLALFIHAGASNALDWVLWTPEGYYDASENGDSLIGWHINRGVENAADFYPAETFASIFKKPEKIDAALDI